MTPPERTTLSCPCPDLNHYPKKKLGDGAETKQTVILVGANELGVERRVRESGKGFWGDWVYVAPGMSVVISVNIRSCFTLWAHPLCFLPSALQREMSFRGRWIMVSPRDCVRRGVIEASGGRRGDDRRWDGWMASPTRWTWVWVNSASWWWTGRPGMLQSMGRKESDVAERLNWT